MEIIINFLYQIVFTVGVIVAFGLIIALCRKAFCKIVGDIGTKILLYTGAIGTPIHELSHAIMCIVFGHKVTAIKLYQPNSSNGTLGYVNHTYNPKNIYHQIGNFFIGVAPIIGGSGVLLLLMFLLAPSVFSETISELQFVSLLSMDFFDITTYVGYFELFWGIIKIIFDFTNAGNVFWWIYISLALMISSHMELSMADIRCGFIGFLFIAGLLLVADIILFFVSTTILENVTEVMVSATLPIIEFLAISAVFSITLILVGGIIKANKKIFKVLQKSRCANEI